MDDRPFSRRYTGLCPIFVDMKDISEDDGRGTARINKMYYCKNRIKQFEQYLGSLFSRVPWGAQRYVLFLYSAFYIEGNTQEFLLCVLLAIWNLVDEGRL
jgi:hypothetical protein